MLVGLIGLAIYIIYPILRGYVKEPISISSLVFVYPEKYRILFTIVMWVLGASYLCLFDMIPQYGPLVWLSIACLLGVGAAPLVSNERNTFHYVCAYTLCVTTQIIVLLVNWQWLFLWILILIPYVLKREVSFYGEIICITTLTLAVKFPDFRFV